MDHYLNNDGNDSDSSATDLLAESPEHRCKNDGESANLEIPLLDHQHQERAATQAVATPHSSNLMNKLDELQRNWTSQGKKKPPSSAHASASTPAFASIHLDDSISPITLFGDIAVEDNASVSTYGSLGSPGSSRAQTPTRTKPYPKPGPRDGVFDRLHRGQGSKTGQATKETGIARGRRYQPKTTPSRPPLGSARKPISEPPKKRPSFLQRFSQRKVAPIPQSPMSTASVSSSVVATPSTQGGKISVFERLYRKQRRSKTLWTDPGTKKGRKFKYIPSDGASRTSVIDSSPAGDVDMSGVQRRLTFQEQVTLDGTAIGKHVTLIQNIFRFHQAQSDLVKKLMQHWTVEWIPANDAATNASKLQRIQFGMLALVSAIRQVEVGRLAQLARMRHDGTLTLESNTDVCFEAWDKDVVVQLNYIVSVKCQASSVEFLKSWSLEKLAYHLHLNAIVASYEAETLRLQNEAHAVIQQFMFKIAYNKKKQPAALSPTPSTVSENSTLRQRQTYNSLSWFHDRLQKEAMSAKQARIDVAALVIQSAWRRCLARQHAQALWDAQLASEEEEEGGGEPDTTIPEQGQNQEHDAAKAIQSLVRMHQAVDFYQYTRKMAIYIQAFFRQQLAQARLKATVRSVVIIQRAWRSALARSMALLIQEAWEQRDQDQQHDAAKAIQSLVRMHQAVDHYKHTRKMITYIQAFFRQQLTQARLKATVRSAVIIQRAWKSALARSMALLLREAWEQREQDQQHNAAMAIQSLVRMHKAVDHYQHNRKMIVYIQAFFRQQLAQARLRATVRSAVIIQRAWRSALARSMSLLLQVAWEQRDQDQEHDAAKVIQSIFRSHKAKTCYGFLRSKAIHIQAFVRRYMAQKTFKENIRCIVLIQTAWRSALAKSTALLLQDVWDQRQQNEKHDAAVAIQSLFRSRKAKAIYELLQSNASFMQVWVRFHIARKRIIKNKQEEAAISLQTFTRMRRRAATYRLLRRKAVQIQTFYRLYSSRKRLRERKQIEAACKIQCWFRMCRDMMSYRTLRLKAIVLQGCMRKYLATSRRRLKESIFLFRQKVALQRIQRRARAYLQQKNSLGPSEEVGATKLQAFYRGRRARLHLQLSATTSCTIQRYWRGYMAHSAYKQIRKSLVCIQRLGRQFLRRKLAATTVQQAYRGARDRNSYLIIRSKAVYLQRAWRVFLVRQAYLAARSAVRQRRLDALVLIQSWTRLTLSRWKFAKCRRAVRMIQRAFRHHYQAPILPQQPENERNELWNSAARIQASWRLFRIKKIWQGARLAAILIQKTYRGFHALHGYLALRGSAQTLQRVGRGYNVRLQLSRMDNASVVCQRLLRGHHVRRSIAWRHKHAMILQRIYRGYQARTSYQIIRPNAIRIQTCVRMSLAKSSFEKKRRAAAALASAFRKYQIVRGVRNDRAKILQAACRGFLARRRHLWMIAAGVKIQTVYRAWSCHRATRRKLQQLAYVRTVAGIVRFQSALRGRLQRLAFTKLVASMKRLQSLWRGKLLLRAVIRLQSLQRRRMVQNTMKEWKVAASLIAAMYSKKKFYLPKYQQRISAMTIQRCVRMWICRNNRKTLAVVSEILPPKTKLKFSAKVNSRMWGRRVRLLLLDRMEMASRIQRWFRGGVEQRRYCRARQAVILLQRWTRRQILPVARRRKESATIIQSHWRKAVATENFHVLLLSSAFISKRTREQMIRKYYKIWGGKVRGQLRLRAELASRIQRSWRVYKARLILNERRESIMLEASTVLQTYARAWACRRTVLPLLQRRRECCTKVQSWWRMVQRRAHFLKHLKLKQEKAATQMQKRLRMVIYRQRFHAQRKAAVAIQIHLRHGLLQRVRLRKRMELAAATIQSTWRKAVAIENFRLLQLTTAFLPRNTVAAMTSRIQGPIWGAQVRRQLYLRAESAVLIQAIWRCYVQSAFFKQMKQASVAIQSRWRAYIGRSTLLKQKRSAELIQANYKGMVLRKQFAQLRNVCVLQRAWKAYLVRSKERREYASACTLQAYARAYNARKQLLHRRRVRASTRIQTFTRLVVGRMKQRRAITKIQTAWRLRLCLTQYQQKKSSSVVLQSLFRMYSVKLERRRMKCAVLKMEGAWQTYHLKTRTKAATELQNAVRGSLARKHLRIFKAAVVLIQTRWRVSSSRAKYNRMQQASKKIQQFTRKRCHLRAQRQLAATECQKYWRGWMVARQYSKLKNAAATIQSTFRKVQSRRAVSRVKKQHEDASRKVQALVRKSIAHRKFLKLKNGAVLLQKMTRKYIRRRANMRSRASKTLQKAGRFFLKRRKMHKAATKLQKVFRARVLEKVERAALTIQPIVRGWLLRKLLVQLALEESALILQRNWRNFSARKRAEKRWSSICLLQRVWRNHCASRKAEAMEKARSEELFQDMAVVIQKHARIYKAKSALARRKSAILEIQRWAGARLLRIKYQKLGGAVIFIQAHVRRSLAPDLISMRVSAVAIQAQFRRLCCKKQYLLVLEHTRKDNMAVRLQCFVRMLLARMMLQSHLKAARAIQRWWCAIMSRRMLSLLTLEKSKRDGAVLIQSSWRRARCLSSFKAARASICLVQATTRCHLQSVRYRQTRQAAIKVQALFRLRRDLYSVSTPGPAAKSPNTKLAAATLQRAWKSHSERLLVRKQARHDMEERLQKFARRQLVRRREEEQRRQLQAASKIQREWKAFLALKQNGLQLDRICSGATVIQARWRREYCESKYTKTRVLICLIQSNLRRYVIRRRYLRLKAAALVIQSFQRRLLAQKRCHGMKTTLLSDLTTAQQAKAREVSTLAIQSRWRAFVTIRLFEKKKLSLVKIQALARKFFATRKLYQLRAVQKAQDKLHVSAIAIQRSWRTYSAVKVFRVQIICVMIMQAIWRMHRAKKLYFNQRRCAVLLQALFRKCIAQRKAIELAGAQKRFVLHIQEASATTIQARWRAHCAAKAFEEQKASLVKIQALLRRRSAAKALRNLKAARQAQDQLQEVSAKAIQSRWRACLASRFLQARKVSLVKIQSLCRRRAAVHMLKSVKAARQQAQVEVLVVSATLIQSRFRSFVASRALAERRASLVKIQSLARRNAATRMLKSLRAARQTKGQHQEASATLTFQIQEKAPVAKSQKPAAMEGGVRVLDYVPHEAAKKIQSLARKNSAMRRLKLQHMAALKIQCRFIFWRNSQALLAIQSSAVLIRRSYNGLLPGEATFFAIQQFNSVKGPMLDRYCRKEDIVRVKQENWNLSFALLDQCQQIDEAVAYFRNFVAMKIERSMRRHLARRRAMKLYKSLSAGDLHWQNADDELLSWIRMFKVQDQLDAQRYAARAIQHFYRKRKQASSSPWQELVRGMVLLQSYFRVYRARAIAKRRKQNIKLLQRNFRLLLTKRRERAAEKARQEYERLMLSRVRALAERDANLLLAGHDVGVPCLKRRALQIHQNRFAANKESDDLVDAAETFKKVNSTLSKARLHLL